MKKIPHLLATDLDGTFAGDEEGLRNLLSHYETLEEPISLAYITGRHRASAAKLIYEESLPIPDLLITDVGTVIYSGPDFSEDEEWGKKMSAEWYPDEIIKAAKNIPGLMCQNLPHKRRVSFHSKGLLPARALETQLIKRHIAHTFIFSSNRDVDILPQGGGKGEALKFSITKYVEKEANILVAGDSGNDLDMLQAGYPAVIVSNARAELSGIEADDTLFRASYPYAQGILEAWQHFYGTGK
ncbi:HAD-IIB family hydrolase [Lacicoccus alkaliphilus]|uniref:Sucrose-phosphate synthase n=1 Tax=Lacicoccus alkaliphilus DSM 16010 TaxID=1123231 RepID=A0A1M7GXK9_9BACL|nr:HAD-IIB family hydrolase [Salinicoccus alkaliphilus]SHM21091.1 sucrose-phosphate synthase [Salinicoccus alkaliphilus DSM 16010]